MATMRDIAKLAEVSVGTVSRVLNADTTLQITPQTRNKILTTAEELNYIKQREHKSAKRGRIAITGWYTKEVKLSDLYFRSLRWGVETTLKNENYDIVRTFINEEIPSGKGIDGIIAIGYFDQKSINQLKDTNVPFVIINQNTLDYGVSCVTADYVTPVRQIIDHLISKGIKKIGMIEGYSPSEVNAAMDPRAQAFRNIMHEKKLLNEKLIFSGDFTIESGFDVTNQVIKELKDDLPQAFFVCSDTMAIGVIKSLQTNNIKIPDQTGVIGFGNLDVSKYINPSLSTVSLDTRQMGVSAVNTLVNILNGTQPNPINVVTTTTVIYRDSSL